MPHIGSVAGRDRIRLVVRHDLVSRLVRLARGLCRLKEFKGEQRYQTKRSGLEIVPRFARGSVLRFKFFILFGIPAVHRPGQIR